MQCTRCNGWKVIKGQVTCGECNGAGSVEKSAPCPDCSGTGQVSRKCEACGGSGSQDGASCGICSGSGYAKVACDGKCGGNGTITVSQYCPATVEGDVPCPDCYGTGELPDGGGAGEGAGGGSADGYEARLIQPQGDPGTYFACGVEHPNCPQNYVTLRNGELVTEKHHSAHCDLRVTKNQYGVTIQHASGQHHCAACGQNFGSA